MKGNKHKLLIFLIGLLLGSLLTGVGMTARYQVRGRTKETASKEAAGGSDITKEQTSEEQMSEEATEVVVMTEHRSEPQPQEALDAWNRETVYNGGDEAAYGGKRYRAKWWTQGEEPGKADVWEDTLVAAEQPKDVLEEEPVLSLSNEEWTAKKEDFKIVGYFPSWKEDTSKIRYDILTHINYAFAIPTAEASLLPLENAELAQQIIREAHAKGVRVFLAVGGWSYHDVPLEPAFVAATETAQKREKLAGAIVSMCEIYGFDGVDLDWEHPRVDGNSSRQYEELLLLLAEQLHAQGKELSSAVLSGVTADGNVYYDAAAHTDTVLETVDWINVMAYDGGDGERHSPYELAVNSGNYWRKQRGMPAEKVVLGVPFYARPSWAAYGDILSSVPDAWKYDHTDYNGMDAWYNGIAAIQQKTSYAMEQLGGVMIWEISQDAKGQYSLQKAIGDCIMKDKKTEE